MFAMLISQPSLRRLCQAGLGGRRGRCRRGRCRRGENEVRKRGRANIAEVRKVKWDQGMGRQGENRQRDMERVEKRDRLERPGEEEMTTLERMGC